MIKINIYSAFESFEDTLSLILEELKYWPEN